MYFRFHVESLPSALTDVADRVPHTQTRREAVPIRTFYYWEEGKKCVFFLGSVPHAILRMWSRMVVMLCASEWVKFMKSKRAIWSTRWCDFGVKQIQRMCCSQYKTFIANVICVCSALRMRSPTSSVTINFMHRLSLTLCGSSKSRIMNSKASSTTALPQFSVVVVVENAMLRHYRAIFRTAKALAVFAFVHHWHDSRNSTK